MNRPVVSALRTAHLLIADGLFRFTIPIEQDLCRCKNIKVIAFDIKETSLERLPLAASPTAILLDPKGPSLAHLGARPERELF